MTLSFRISAPGKVILFGEHAVVHGKTAIAVSLDRRTSLEFTEHDDSHVQVELLKLDILEKIPFEDLQKGFLGAPSDHDELLEHVKKLVKIQDDDGGKKAVSVQCFLYALFQVARAEGLELRPFRLRLDSELSIGAGTGSSASYSVALNAAFVRWSRLQVNHDAPMEFSKDDLERISSYAYNCERIMHGLPSGIDNSICTFGSVIQFRRGEPLKFVSLGGGSFRILLVDTRVQRNTKKLVARVAELLRRFPTMFHKLLECFDDLSLTSIDIFRKLQELDDSDHQSRRELFNELSTLVDINQGLLSTCQVSHPSLDLICATAKKYGFSAKLTGAGGGGYAYVLIPPGSSVDTISLLKQELTDNSFTVTETNVGGAGVTIYGAGSS